MGVAAVAQHQPTFTTIDARLAGGRSGYGTEVIVMNPAGVATGYYVGYDNIVHAYVRTPEGGVDRPGACCCDTCWGTFPSAAP
jgi:hypothetical protein